MAASRNRSLFGRRTSRRRGQLVRPSKRRTRQSAKFLQTLEPRLLLAVTTAVNDGDWHDANTWSNGVPDLTVRAIVGQDVTVQLDGVEHEAEELVVHGTLNVPETLSSGAGSSVPTELAPDRLKVYFDGSLAGSKQGSQLWSHIDPIAIGGVNGDTRTHTGNQSTSRDVTFQGEIDDVLNYNRALMADELAALHANQQGAFFQVPTDGLTAGWKFTSGSLDDYASEDAIDDNGTRVDGTQESGAWRLQLDEYGEQINVASSPEINQGKFVEKTISLWFNVDQTTGRQVLYEQGGGARGLSIYLDGSTLYAGGWNVPDHESGWDGDWVAIENITAGEWHHVALVLDANATASTTTPLNGGTKTLTTRWMHINSNGVFQIGTSGDRYDEGNFELTLTGTQPDSDHIVETAGGTITVEGNDGFLMTDSGGGLQFYGEEKLTFTKLSSTVEKGARQITVQNVIERNFTEGGIISPGQFVTSAADDGELNWEVGDKIVIASSSHDYREEDRMEITAITDNGDGTSTLTLDEPLNHRHYGQTETYSNATRDWEIDMRAEVGLLSRNVRIQGTAGQDTDNDFGDRGRELDDQVVTYGVGAHTMIMDGSGPITVDGVQLDRMGQTGRLGRYPIHWHVAHDRTGDILRNTSVTNSNNRGVTIHGSQNIEIEGVLLHDIHGHGFFLEDGVETGNNFTANIAFGIHRVGSKLSENNFNQEVGYEDPFAVDLHDEVFVKGPRGVLSAAFWVTNPDNDYIGNVTAGSQGMGFWYIGANGPLGLSAGEDIYSEVEPFNTRMGRNEFSTVHSTGTGFGVGEPGFMPDHFQEFVPEVFEGLAQNLTSYKNHVGTWVETEIDFDEYRAADNHTQFRSFDELEMRNSLIVGDSVGNASGNYDPINRHPRQIAVIGIGIYQEGINVVDTHFAGLEGDRAYTFSYQGDDGFNRFASTFKGITFEGDNRDGQLKASPDLANSNQVDRNVNDQSYLYDIDGSLTGTAGSTVVFQNAFLKTDSSVKVGKNLYMTTDKLFGKIFLNPISGSGATTPAVDITSADGDSSQIDRGNDFEHVVLLNDGDTRITFNSMTNWNSGFELELTVDASAETPVDASGIFVLENLPSGFSITNANLSTSLDALNNSGVTSYFVDAGGDIWVKVFANDGKVLQFTNS